MANTVTINEAIKQAQRQHAEDMDILTRAAAIALRYGFTLQIVTADHQATTPILDDQPEITHRSNQVSQSGNPRAPIRTGLSAAVRDIYSSIRGEFTIRTIFDLLQIAHPDLAAGENAIVGISAVLGRDKDQQKIRLISTGTAGAPSVYHNVSTQNGQTRFSTLDATDSTGIQRAENPR